MSLSERREEIKAALSELDGVTAYVKRPATPRPGDVWPRLGPVVRDDESGQFYVTWRVLVFLPQEEAKASEWLDEHLFDLFDALVPVGYVDGAEPVMLVAGGQPGGQYALEITMRGE